MSEAFLRRDVYIKVGDVIDLRDSAPCQTKKGKQNLRCMIRDQEKRRRIQVFLQPEAANFLKGRVTQILWVKLFPRCIKGKWYNEVDIEAVVENAPEAEANLVSENTPQTTTIVRETSDEVKVDGLSDFLF